MYSGSKTTGDRIRLPNPCNTRDVQALVGETLKCLIHKPDLSEDDDFFAFGLDSLQTMEIAHALKAGLELYPAERGSVTPKAIYANPTARKLPVWLDELLSGADRMELDHDGADQVRVQAMANMVEKYTSHYPTASGTVPLQKRRVQGNKICVALTGSTGTLGTNILQTLLQDPRVSGIYCLNRAADARLRQDKVFAERGLPHLLNNNKVVFLTAKFGDPQFGQSDSTYQYMLDDVDVVVHNAWKVDFNHHLESFEPEHVRGTHFMIEWCRKTSAAILFVSSISSISFYGQCFPEARSVPETPLTDYRTAKNIGYGESKHVAERILQAARGRCGVMTSNLRVGQVAGPSSPSGGVWNRNEHIPALVQTSLELGCMPATFQDIDWTPVDAMGRILVDLAHVAGHGREIPQVFHLTNPHVVPWSDFLETVQSFYAEHRQIRAIPLSEWVDLLRKVDQSNAEELNRLPAAKLLEFFEDVDLATRNAVKDVRSSRSKGKRLQQWLDTGNGTCTSQTMAKLRPMTKDLFQTWLEQWGFRAPTTGSVKEYAPSGAHKRRRLGRSMKH